MREGVSGVPVHWGAPHPAPHLVQHRLVQLLLLNAQVADPGQELPGLDEEAGAQEEGEDVGFLGGHRERQRVLTKARQGCALGSKPSPSPSVYPMRGGRQPTLMPLPLLGGSPTSG